MPTPAEHPFAQYVRILGKGKTGSRSLNRDEAEDAMAMIMRGEVQDVQLGAFLMLLRVKEESAEELAGFVSAVRNSIIAPQSLSADLDWSSYAGKRRQLPWYLLAALSLADSGQRVFMHGAAGHTAGRIYSEGVLETLGIPAAADWQQVRQQLDDSSFAFMPLGQFCPTLQRIIDLRNHFGLRSPVHTLSRLINPLRAPCSMQSIFHPAYAKNHQRAAQLLGQPHAAVFKGEAGEVERKPEADCRVFYLHDSEAREELWPRLMEGRQPWREELNVDELKKFWRGESRDDYGQQAVIGTIAIAVKLKNPGKSQDAALQAAADIWEARQRDRLG